MIETTFPFGENRLTDDIHIQVGIQDSFPLAYRFHLMQIEKNRKQFGDPITTYSLLEREQLYRRHFIADVHKTTYTRTWFLRTSMRLAVASGLNGIYFALSAVVFQDTVVTSNQNNIDAMIVSGVVFIASFALTLAISFSVFGRKLTKGQSKKKK